MGSFERFTTKTHYNSLKRLVLVIGLAVLAVKLVIATIWPGTAGSPLDLLARGGGEPRRPRHGAAAGDVPAGRPPGAAGRRPRVDVAARVDPLVLLAPAVDLGGVGAGPAVGRRRRAGAVPAGGRGAALGLAAWAVLAVWLALGWRTVAVETRRARDEGPSPPAAEAASPPSTPARALAPPGRS
jgi:hypothetical protein